MVMEMAANNIATSAIGCQVESFDWRIARGVPAGQRKAAAPM
jgi:hypothetical protein